MLWNGLLRKAYFQRTLASTFPSAAIRKKYNCPVGPPLVLSWVDCRIVRLVGLQKNLVVVAVIRLALIHLLHKAMEQMHMESVSYYNKFYLGKID